MTQSHPNRVTETLAYVELADKLLEILEREFGNIPYNGFIAGGAVASAIFELTGLPFITRYKDLDVFIPTTETTETFITYKNSNATKPFSTGSSLVECQFGSISKNTYAILSTEMKGKTNEIKIRIETPEDSNNPCHHIAETIIGAFDLNCVQACLYFHQGKPCLTISEEFKAFLYSKTIAPTNFFTGAHTLVRMLNKAEQQRFKIKPDAIRKLVDSIAIADHHAQTSHVNGCSSEPAISGWLMAEEYKNKLITLAQKHALPITVDEIIIEREGNTFSLFKPLVTRRSEEAKKLIKFYQNCISSDKRIDRMLLHSILNLLNCNVTNEIPTSQNNKINQMLLAITNRDALWDIDILKATENLYDDLGKYYTFNALTSTPERPVNFAWVYKLNEILNEHLRGRKANWLGRHIQNLMSLTVNNKYTSFESYNSEVPNMHATIIIKIVEAMFIKRFEPSAMHRAFQSQRFTVLEAIEAYKLLADTDTPYSGNYTAFRDETNGKYLLVSQTPCIRTETTDIGTFFVHAASEYQFHKSSGTLPDLNHELSCTLNGLDVTPENLELIQEVTNGSIQHIFECDIPF
ncbi:hypothetical protein [Vibrio owensii]|uniref:hypothetical protein n=1 Tax=Vibrio owensii TaxID=696485 RepID=UPI0018F24F6D|nr:hypothetical protein [Vibrio owensii]